MHHIMKALCAWAKQEQGRAKINKRGFNVAVADGSIKMGHFNLLQSPACFTASPRNSMQSLSIISVRLARCHIDRKLERNLAEKSCLGEMVGEMQIARQRGSLVQWTKGRTPKPYSCSALTCYGPLFPQPRVVCPLLYSLSCLGQEFPIP